MTVKLVRVAGYVRVSTADQARGFGQDMQEDALRRYVASRGPEGWLLPEDGLFVEQASGADPARPVLGALMKRVQAGDFDVVLVWRLDRISRSLGDMIKIQWQLNKSGAALVSIKESLDFTTPSGRLVFHMFGALAEFERATIQMRTLEGKRASALSGNFVGATPPYGYRKVPNPSGRGSKLHIEERDARWVRQIFTWYTKDGKTFSQIAAELNALGIPKSAHVPSNKKSPRWYDRGIRHILTRKIYTGQCVTNRTTRRADGTIETRSPDEWIINQVPPIIAKAVFRQAQDRLQNGPHARGGGRQTYMLARKLIDPTTGRPFTGYRSAKGTLNYRRPKFTDTNGTVHSGFSIAAGQVDRFVWNALRQALDNPEAFLVAQAARNNDPDREADLRTELKGLRETLREAVKRRKRIEDDYYNGYIDESKRNELLARFGKAEDATRKMALDVEARLDRSRRHIATNALRTVASRFRDLLDNTTYKERAKLCSRFVDHVELGQTDTERYTHCYLRFDEVRTPTDQAESRTPESPKLAHGSRFPRFSDSFGDDSLSAYQINDQIRGANTADVNISSRSPYLFKTSAILARRNPRTRAWEPVFGPTEVGLKGGPRLADQIRRATTRVFRSPRAR